MAHDGAAAAELVDQFGPRTVKALGDLKDVVLNNRDKIQKAMDVVGDISKAAKPEDVMKHFDTLEKAVGVKIPDIAKSKASEIVQEKLKKVDMDGIKKVLDFIGTFNVEEAATVAEAIERAIVIDELHRATSGAYIGEGDDSVPDWSDKITVPINTPGASYRPGRGRRDYIMTKDADPEILGDLIKKPHTQVGDSFDDVTDDDSREDAVKLDLQRFADFKKRFADFADKPGRDKFRTLDLDDYHVYFYDSLTHGS